MGKAGTQAHVVPPVKAGAPLGPRRARVGHGHKPTWTSFQPLHVVVFAEGGRTIGSMLDIDMDRPPPYIANSTYTGTNRGCCSKTADTTRGRSRRDALPSCRHRQVQRKRRQSTLRRLYGLATVRLQETQCLGEQTQRQSGSELEQHVHLLHTSEPQPGPQARPAGKGRHVSLSPWRHTHF